MVVVITSFFIISLVGVWLIAYFVRKNFIYRPREDGHSRKVIREWATWGASSSWYLAPLFNSELKAKCGVALYNGGASGQGVETICARLGSHPAKLAFPGNVIPASGTVKVTSLNVHFYRYVDYTGRICGVHGRLRRKGDGSPLTFTRTEDGRETPMRGPSEFIPEEGFKRRSSPTLLWLGKNDVDSKADTAKIVEKVVRYTDEAFKWLLTQNEHVVVLGHFVNRNTSSTDPARDQINQINDIYAQRYGERYIDIQSWLISPQIWVDLGRKPTEQDLLDQAAGMIPQSLARDHAHLTDEAYAGIGSHLILPRASLLSTTS